jgi:uncharacterized GH25 family protein
MKRILFSIVLTFFFASSAMSHSLWINLHESYAHNPGHAISSIGWGHSVPMDDFLGSKAGLIEIEKYEILSPDGTISSLGIPEIKPLEKTKTSSGITISKGDLAARKIGLTDLSQKGTYQVTASLKSKFFTSYIDKNGKTKMVTKPMDEVKDAKSFNLSIKYKNEAKSYMTIDRWSDPKPSGNTVEITPMSDLSKLKPDDLAEFEITLNGKSLSSSKQEPNYIYAASNTYGGPDNFSLCSMIRNGKAQIRIPSAGQWLISVNVKKNVDKDNELKELYGKCQSISYRSSLTVNVKP